MEKASFLQELGADRLLLPDLPLAGLEYFARRMVSRKPAALARIKDPHRTIEVACFLRLMLLRLMDGTSPFSIIRSRPCGAARGTAGSFRRAD